MPPAPGGMAATSSASEAFDEHLNNVYVQRSALVTVPGIFERDYTAYSVLAKLDKKQNDAAAAANNKRGRTVDKRFSEFETFHEALAPALQEAVGVKRRKAEKLMLEARKAMAAVDTMQKHVGLLGSILEKANGGWFGKNSPEEVANRIKMLNSYLRGCMRFAEHERVHEALASFVLNGSTEAEWTPDPNDPNQVIDTIEEEADGRKKMIEDLYISSSISAEERDVMLGALSKDTGFEVHTLMKQHAAPTDSRVAAAAAAGAAIAGDPTAKLKKVAATVKAPQERGAKPKATRSVPSPGGSRSQPRPDSPMSAGSATTSDSEDDDNTGGPSMEIELDAGESAVYSGALVVTLPPSLAVPPSRLRVKAKLPNGGTKQVVVPHDALPGQTLLVDQPDTGGASSGGGGYQEDPFEREEQERRRKIEERSFNPDDVGLDDIMANALGPKSFSPPPAPAPAPRAPPPRAAAVDSEEVTSVRGKRYTCVRRSQIRASVGTESDKVGTLEVGQEVLAMEGRRLAATQAVRIRFERGWTSLVSGNGEAILQEAAGGSAAQEAEDARSARAAEQDRQNAAAAPILSARPETPPALVDSFAPMKDAWDEDAGGSVGTSMGGGWGADQDDDEFGGGGGDSGFGSGATSGGTTPSLASMMSSAGKGADAGSDDDDLDNIMARAGLGGGGGSSWGD